MKYLYIGLGLLCVLAFFYLKKIRRKKFIDVHALVKENSQPKNVSKEQIHIKVEHNQWNQINIVCSSMDHKKIGEMLSTYTLSDTTRQSGPAYTVHLENILVSRRYRKRGVGTYMIAYLLKEMVKIEKKENCRFRYIYGEIGQGGTDDPHISIPFYERLDGMAYDNEKKLQYQRKRKESLDGYDCFYYYIVENS